MENQNAIRIPSDVKCISFVGGGGKTTLIMRLAAEQAALGRRVIVTTTTHMFRPGVPGEERQYPRDLIWISREDPRALMEGLDRAGLVLVGLPDEKSDRKIVGVSRDFFGEMMAQGDLVLVEADGSRRRPVKVPRDREPVIPEESELTVAVAGLTALGRSLGEVCYEPEDTARFLDRELPLYREGEPAARSGEHCLTPAELARILSSRQGLRKWADTRYQVILNQADNSRLAEYGREILDILGEEGIPGQLCTRRERLDLVLLAAGNSRRFGGNKLLEVLPDGKPLYLHAVELAESLPEDTFSRRILVSQYPEILEAMAARRGWIPVKNDQPDLGISRSVILGTRVSEDTDGWMFCVCDQPELTKDTMEAIIRRWRQGHSGMVSAAWQGSFRNPAIFSACYGEALQQLAGDRGGGRLMAAAPWDVETVEVGSEREIRDIDTRRDICEKRC